MHKINTFFSYVETNLPLTKSHIVSQFQITKLQGSISELSPIDHSLFVSAGSLDIGDFSS